MKTILSTVLISVFVSSFLVLMSDVSAKSSGYYYRNSQSGQYTTKGYSYKNPSTTQRQSRR